MSAERNEAFHGHVVAFVAQPQLSIIAVISLALGLYQDFGTPGKTMSRLFTRWKVSPSDMYTTYLPSLLFLSWIVSCLLTRTLLLVVAINIYVRVRQRTREVIKVGVVRAVGTVVENTSKRSMLAQVQ